MKRMILAFGALGLVGCFLPLVSGVSWWDLRHVDGWTVYLVLAAFAAPLLIGLGGSDRTLAGALGAAASFGFLGYKFGWSGVTDLVLHGAIGGILMGIAIIGGLVASILALGQRKT